MSGEIKITDASIKELEDVLIDLIAGIDEVVTKIETARAIVKQKELAVFMDVLGRNIQNSLKQALYENMDELKSVGAMFKEMDQSVGASFGFENPLQQNVLNNSEPKTILDIKYTDSKKE